MINESYEKILKALKIYLPLNEWKEDILKVSEERIKYLPIKDIVRNFRSNLSPSIEEVRVFQQILKRLINYHIPENIHYLLKRDEDEFLLKQILLAEREINKGIIEEKKTIKKSKFKSEPEPKPESELEKIYYGKIPTDLLKDETVGWSAKCQYGMYHNFSIPKELSEKPECTVGVTRMAFEMNLSQRQIKDNDRQLKRAGWIKKIPHGKGKTSSTILIGEKFYSVKIYYDDDGAGGKIVRLEIIDPEQYDLSIKYYKEQDKKELEKFENSEENNEP